MTRTNLPNTQHGHQVALDLLHGDRRFFPTARQQQLCEALLSAPFPENLDQRDGEQAPVSDSLVLLGYGGAMGGGKTRTIAELAIDAALMNPGNNILVARHHLSDLSSTTMKEFFAHCPPGLIARRQQSPTTLVELRLKHWSSEQTSTVNFRHLSDWRGLGSQQYGAVLIDEAGQVDEDAALMLLTRLRHPAQTQRWFVAAANPWPGWFQRWFVRRDLPEQALQEARGQVRFIPARIEDNPHLPDNYAELNQALLPTHWRARFIEGSFDSLMGRVYPDFDPQVHLWKGRLPKFAARLGGLDFGGQTGTSHYTAGLVAGLARLPAPSPPLAGGDAEGRGGVRPGYTLIRLAEFEDRGPGVTQRLEDWQRQCRKRFGHISWAADRSQSAWIDHQKRRGLDIQPAAGSPGSVAYGLSLVHDRLAADPPTSFYTPELTQFPQRMSEYVWQAGDDPDPRPRKKNDDLLDADRYLHELAAQRPAGGNPSVVIVRPLQSRVAHWSNWKEPWPP